ncbi:MAG: NAD(P)/FAD-dependent oxidoreductase [Rhodoferax sp.]|nr:NAD(P)/FAD-dependent oxidoreductase [Rhodoferax sp.]
MTAQTQRASIETDALVIGAGPVGLFQAFQLGLLEMRTHIIDCLPHPGGQCAELYPDKPIYDIPAISVCTGQELTRRLLQQIAPFQHGLHLGQEVNTVERQPSGQLLVTTNADQCFLTRTLFIAAGVGAFKPRTLAIAEIESFAGRQLFYAIDDPAYFANKHVVIVGGTDTALEHALRLCPAHEDGNIYKAASVTLIHRRDAFQANPETTRQFRQLCDRSAIRFIAGQIQGFTERLAALSSVTVLGADTRTQAIPLDRLLVLLGLSPKLGPIAQWGLQMERRQLVVDTEKFATSEAGIFAVGDINTYPGKKKLILCGFHEATLAAYAAADLVFPSKRGGMQYTTTSPRLHQLLGVAPQASR